MKEHFGNIDINLFDQLLKGRIIPGMRILDAGCGEGRNLVYFLREDYDVFAVDRSEQAIQKVRKLAAELNNRLQEEQFRVEPVEKLSFANDTFDVVISCAVLHFAEDERHFQRMASEMWRVLKPGGLFFARLASNIGIENQVRPLGGNRFELPDGSERYLVDSEALHYMTEKLHGVFVDPIKTVQVEGQRSMTTWCMKKPHILFFDPIQDMFEEKVEKQERSDGSILDIMERSTT
ncbi:MULTISPECIES: class I SAM-dependent methyltransferase [unclassified Paenibacillus]|uniref:class I SAM-dependent methyltransferase n=1 Tax=unclassified Paenibacillus TaxID=185978 RepID=UPI001B5C4D3A|nr:MULTISPECIES: class I SAM-dependent methyltransferase [unclassified Paenibacillus]MBP1155529.1 SAM-dependent methyltransferase [Paenibacillus sp. PvP091]MBP1169085.1 SAM-dependent methyltransferase [Paenibacillus sp. PvR098]MBP2440113.1 SAM-dependent methyltransferase [Paenibacillus sp. PvP052]